MRAAHQRAQSRAEFVQINGLDDVIIGAEIETTHAIWYRVARGQHQDGDRNACATHLSQHVHAVHAGQPKVEYCGDVGVRAQLPPRCLAVAHPIDLEALLLQARTNAVSEQGVVFDKQDAHG